MGVGRIKGAYLKIKDMKQTKVIGSSVFNLTKIVCLTSYMLK